MIGWALLLATALVLFGFCLGVGMGLWSVGRDPLKLVVGILFAMVVAFGVDAVWRRMLVLVRRLP